MKFCGIFLLLSGFLSFSLQTALCQVAQPRLRGEIREGKRAALPGSMLTRVLRGKDLGPVRADQVLHGVTLVFRRSEAQEAELQQLLVAQQTAGSPEFHDWLTPEAFGLRFGMADADLEATERWLTAQGFAITGVSRARDRISFSGSAAQVASAFGSPLHRYQIDGESHIAPSAELRLPAELAAVTTAVLHLSDFRPHPNAHPRFTAAADQTHYLTPGDLRVMYNLPTGTAANYSSGYGQAIAIIGQSYVDTSNSNRFRQFDVTTETLSLTGVLVPGTGVEAISPGDAAETEIDLEYAGGVAPAAELFLVHVGSDPHFGAFDALAFAIDQNLAPVVSISYSECETLLSAAELQQGDALFEQAGAQGQTLVAASGDAGSTACAQYAPSSFLSAAQQQALVVEYPANSPHVTAVGGTQMAAGTFAAGNTTYWGAAPIPGFDFAESLLSYAPEVAWNEDSSSRIFASGGGASAMYGRPSWQSGVAGIPAGATRLLPDVSLEASVGNPGFLLCTDDPDFLRSQGQRTGCYTDLRGDNGQFTVGGGTSFAAPVFAAMTALLNQNLRSLGQGNLNPTLYGLAANSASRGSVFHDITSGSNACTPGFSLCSADGASSFAAGPGYDQATGLGSVDFAQLLAAWPVSAGGPISGSIVQINPANVTAAAGEFDPLTVYVYAYPFENGTTPTGSFSVAVDGAVVESARPLSSSYPGVSTGDYLFYAPASAGSHIVTVTYPGDAAHGSSAATFSVLVGNVLATGQISIAATDVALRLNGSGTSKVTITPAGGYNGRVFWSLSLTGGDSGDPSLCYGIPTLTVEGVSSTTLSLGSGSTCSAALPAARAAELRPLRVQHAASVSGLKGWKAVSVAAGLLLPWLFPVARRRALPVLCLLLMVVGAGGVVSGCGGSNSAATSGPAGATVPAGRTFTYAATLTGRDSLNGAITTSTNFTVVVQ